MLQVRNLPDDVHERLKKLAAQERMSLSDYVARQLAELVRHRSNAEIVAAARVRAAQRASGPTRSQIVAARAEAREEHDAEAGIR